MEQLAFLQEIGCDEMQGFLVSRATWILSRGSCQKTDIWRESDVPQFPIVL